MNSGAVEAVDVEIISYFFSKDRASFKFMEETYRDWALLTCEEGKFDYRIADQTGGVQVGEAVLCPPGEALYRVALTKLTFHFAVFRLKASKRGQPVDFPYQGKLSFRNTSRLLSSLVSMRDSRENVSLRYAEHLLSDILYQYIGEREALRKVTKPQDAAILEAVRFINEQAFSEVSMQFVASHVGLSQSQFTRKFQKEVGVSPVKYITRLRLEKVKLMLAETDDSLETIAERCGFKNAFYLSRVFSAVMNISPSHYRGTHQV